MDQINKLLEKVSKILMPKALNRLCASAIEIPKLILNELKKQNLQK